jgi:TolB-like protein/Flp pilus assembly protein TadD
MSGGQDSHAGARPPIVFLSYARADKAQAVRLAHAMQAAGLNVWWDTLIEGGAEFAKTIEAAIGSCDAVVVAWSQVSVASDWVLDEAASGRELRKLVPVSLDGVEPPMGFRRYHSIDLSSWNGSVDSAEIDGIVRGVAAVAGRESPAPLEARAGIAEDAPRLSRRKLILAATGAAIAGVAGLVAWRRGAHLRFFPASGNTVAVLPFENLSGPGQDYFADGLAEEVRATLARNARLLVMAQASSAQFRDSKDSAETIADKLGVAYLLGGSVRRSGDVVRVAADLIDGRSGFSRWSQTFERRITDIFAVQSEIATTVADALVERVDSGDGPRGTGTTAAASPGGTSSVAAFDAYLRGRALYDLSVDRASEQAALAQFDAAIAADSGYAAAYAARARSLTVIANEYGEVARRASLYDAAIAAAERAIAIAPDLADAHSTLGYTLFYGRLDARAAREPFERSVQTGSGEATVLARYAQFSARTGRRDQAAAAMKRALLLDPLNPLIYRAAGTIEYAARRYHESIPLLRRALTMNPKMSRAHAAIGDALMMLGKPGEARAEYLAEPARDFNLSGLAIVEHRLGNEPGAHAAMDRLVAEVGDRSLYQQGQVLAQWGRREAALAALEKARVLRDSGLIYARNDPMLDPLRDDPRLQRLLLGIGFD